MYVCHCRAVNDRAIRHAVEHGARSIEDLTRLCGAGDDCTACWPALTELIEQADAERRSAVLST